MDRIEVFPDAKFDTAGPVAAEFRRRGVSSFIAACEHVHQMPYGYNSDRDDLFILFKEKMGSCATKHAVIGTLAAELGLAVEKNIGIYAMTEEIVTGTDKILAQFSLPYLPMLHCFLVCGDHCVDLTTGNHNGKNRPLDRFLFTASVDPHISAKDEYLPYRSALKTHILPRPEFEGIDLKTVLQAREAGIALLKSKV